VPNGKADRALATVATEYETGSATKTVESLARSAKFQAVKMNAASRENRRTLLWRWGRRKTCKGTQHRAERNHEQQQRIQPGTAWPAQESRTGHRPRRNENVERRNQRTAMLAKIDPGLSALADRKQIGVATLCGTSKTDRRAGTLHRRTRQRAGTDFQ
jgi:hypothetical protein